MMLRCLFCLDPKLNQGRCTSCGIDDSAIVETADAIPPGLILAGRYLFGRLLGASGFDNTYLSLDLRR
jgi:hypothetical protein